MFGGRELFHPRWTDTEAVSDLPARGVHLWTMNVLRLQSKSHLALLSAAEWARANRYANPQQRARYLGGRVGLRLLLGAYGGVHNAELNFGVRGRGKPVLRNRFARGRLGFNYSLSGAYGLYAIAWNRRVGVDLEMWPRRINAAALARCKLTAGERRAFWSLPAARRDMAMLRCWTRKEAHGKALGVGIRYALNRTELFARPESPYWRSTAGAGAAPQILHGIQLQMPFTAVGALVYDGANLAAQANPAALSGWQLAGGGRTPLRA